MAEKPVRNAVSCSWNIASSFLGSPDASPNRSVPAISEPTLVLIQRLFYAVDIFTVEARAAYNHPDVEYVRRYYLTKPAPMPHLADMPVFTKLELVVKRLQANDFTSPKQRSQDTSWRLQFKDFVGALDDFFRGLDGEAAQRLVNMSGLAWNEKEGIHR